MADRFEEYRQHAFHCRKMAEGANTLEMKSNWLHLAENWLSMVPNGPTAKEEAFDNAAEELATGQAKSDSSH